jgi:hypothetical protein
MLQRGVAPEQPVSSRQSTQICFVVSQVKLGATLQCWFTVQPTHVRFGLSHAGLPISLQSPSSRQSTQIMLASHVLFTASSVQPALRTQSTHVWVRVSQLLFLGSLQSESCPQSTQTMFIVSHVRPGQSALLPQFAHRWKLVLQNLSMPVQSVFLTHCTQLRF